MPDLYADSDLARRLERTEATAGAQFVEAHARLQPESGAEWRDFGGTYAMFDGVQSPITQTFGLGMFSSVDDEQLDEIEAFFRQRGAGSGHEVCPLAGVELLQLLSKRGYRPIETSNVLFRSIEGYQPEAVSKVTARLARDDEAQLWIETTRRGWGDPRLDAYLDETGPVLADGLNFVGELDDRVIATASLVICNSVALLTGATTVPEARNQGAHAVLNDVRLSYAVEQGCTIGMFVAEPGSISQRNAERRGFRIAYTRTKWALDR